MKIVQHLIKQPFLTAVSIAAFPHSTWAFAIMFAGIEPKPQFTWAWWAWVMPGGIMGFSIDIGLLSLAYQIRSGQRNLSKLTAFGVLCAAMFYAQFVYISSHMPSLELAAGVRAEWIPLVQLIRDCAIWVFPALLPVALILYAFSDKESSHPTTPPTSLVDIDPADVNVKIITRPEPSGPALAAMEMVALPEPEPVKSDPPDQLIDDVPVSDIAVATPTPLPTHEQSISLKRLRTSVKHCAYCGSPLSPNGRRKYCNDSCKQLAYIARKAQQ